MLSQLPPLPAYCRSGRVPIGAGNAPGTVPRPSQYDGRGFLFVVLEWGRKDGFPGADGSTIGSSVKTIPIYAASGNTLTEGSTGVRLIDVTTNGVLNENNSLVYAIKNPMTHIYNTSLALGDWYTTNTSYQNNNLWNNLKSAFDPCPNGWQVPPDGTWNDFAIGTFVYFNQGSPSASGQSHATNGRLYSKQVWYPATGYRYANNGLFNVVGAYGYYWSTSASNTFSTYLYFDLSSINPNYAFLRAFSFPARCIQE